MDRIHPIVPRPVVPAAIDIVHRVARPARDPERDPEPRERRGSRASQPPAEEAGEVRDGHLDARA